MMRILSQVRQELEKLDIRTSCIANEVTCEAVYIFCCNILWSKSYNRIEWKVGDTLNGKPIKDVTIESLTNAQDYIIDMFEGEDQGIREEVEMCSSPEEATKYVLIVIAHAMNELHKESQEMRDKLDELEQEVQSQGGGLGEAEEETMDEDETIDTFLLNMDILEREKRKKGSNLETRYRQLRNTTNTIMHYVMPTGTENTKEFGMKPDIMDAEVTKLDFEICGAIEPGALISACSIDTDTTGGATEMHSVSEDFDNTKATSARTIREAAENAGIVGDTRENRIKMIIQRNVQIERPTLKENYGKRIIFMLDISGSMCDERKVTAAQGLMYSALRMMRNKEHPDFVASITVIPFESNIYENQIFNIEDYTEGLKFIRSVRNINYDKGRTNISNSLLLTLEWLEAEKFKRKVTPEDKVVINIVNDGQDHMDALDNRFVECGVTINAFFLMTAHNKMVCDEVAKTHGRCFSITFDNQGAPQFEEIQL